MFTTMSSISLQKSVQHQNDATSRSDYRGFPKCKAALKLKHTVTHLFSYFLRTNTIIFDASGFYGSYSWSSFSRKKKITLLYSEAQTELNTHSGAV